MKLQISHPMTISKRAKSDRVFRLLVKRLGFVAEYNHPIGSKTIRMISFVRCYVGVLILNATMLYIQKMNLAYFLAPRFLSLPKKKKVQIKSKEQ